MVLGLGQLGIVEKSQSMRELKLSLLPGLGQPGMLHACREGRRLCDRVDMHVQQPAGKLAESDCILRNVPGIDDMIADMLKLSLLPRHV